MDAASSLAYFDRERVAGFNSDLTHAACDKSRGMKHHVNLRRALRLKVLHNQIAVGVAMIGSCR